MTYDLRSILNGWEYEPGKISVRKIIGRDGHEKIQTRVDLGLLQFEPEGRPDGRRPYGCDSMLTFVETRLSEYIARNSTDEGFVLLAEDCRDLRHEGHLYYQRYLSFFVLEEYDGVEHDTERNLRVIDLCRRYAENEYDRHALEAQRGYVLMMNTRAKVYQATNDKRFDDAMSLLEHGTARLREWEVDEDRPEEDSAASELEVLESLRRELLADMPADAAARLQWELKAALESEDYERATTLRDRLSALGRDEHAA